MSQKNLKDLKLFVSEMMNEIQDTHSVSVAALEEICGTIEYGNAIKVLESLYTAKIKLLDKIYKEIDA
ncbi:MAG: hypothetical protein WC523_04030 [Patescibacteria group bacterium]